jgi:hypothetical protein
MPLSRFSLHGFGKPTTFAGEPTPGGEAFSRLSYGSSVFGGSGFGSKIRDLVDGVYGLFFAGAATKDENARNEMKCPVITLVTVLRGGFLAHYGAGDTDGFATVVALDAAEVRFCNGIGRHEQNSSTGDSYDLGARRYRIASLLSTAG